VKGIGCQPSVAKIVFLGVEILKGGEAYNLKDLSRQTRMPGTCMSSWPIKWDSKSAKAISIVYIQFC
jgi:hypothetical protein